LLRAVRARDRRDGQAARRRFGPPPDAESNRRTSYYFLAGSRFGFQSRRARAPDTRMPCKAQLDRDQERRGRKLAIVSVDMG